MCQMTLYLGNRALPLRGLAGVGLARAKRGKDIKDGNSGQNQQCAPNGVPQILAERVVEKDGRSEDEERRNNGIPPSAIGTLGYFAAAEDKDGAGGDHVEQPFRENGEREELPERTAQQEQQNGKSGLHR